MAETASLANKTARIETRVTEAQKALFQRAADLTGRSLTEFMLSSAEEAAARTVREHDVLTLSGEDRDIFLRALLSPPAPPARLRQAAARYKRLMGRQ